MTVANIILIIGAVVSVLGAGGAGFWYTARHESRASLSESESQFRIELLAEMKCLQAENKALQQRVHDQEREGYKRDEQLIALAATVNEYLPVLLERDWAVRRLRTDGEQVEKDRMVYEERITELEKQVAELMEQIKQLTKKVEPC